MVTHSRPHPVMDRLRSTWGAALGAGEPTAAREELKGHLDKVAIETARLTDAVDGLRRGLSATCRGPQERRGATDRGAKWHGAAEGSGARGATRVPEGLGVREAGAPNLADTMIVHSFATKMGLESLLPEAGVLVDSADDPESMFAWREDWPPFPAREFVDVRVLGSGSFGAVYTARRLSPADAALEPDRWLGAVRTDLALRAAPATAANMGATSATSATSASRGAVAATLTAAQRRLSQSAVRAARVVGVAGAPPATHGRPLRLPSFPAPTAAAIGGEAGPLTAAAVEAHVGEAAERARAEGRAGAHVLIKQLTLERGSFWRAAREYESLEFLRRNCKRPTCRPELFADALAPADALRRNYFLVSELLDPAEWQTLGAFADDGAEARAERLHADALAHRAVAARLRGEALMAATPPDRVSRLRSDAANLARQADEWDAEARAAAAKLGFADVPALCGQRAGYRAKIADGLVARLRALHARRVAHRDIKPTNVMVRRLRYRRRGRDDEEGEGAAAAAGRDPRRGDCVRLIDWGESCVEPRCITNGAVGTAYYLAPEIAAWDLQAVYRRGVAPRRATTTTFDFWRRADIWAAGLTLLELYALGDQVALRRTLLGYGRYGPPVAHTQDITLAAGALFFVENRGVGASVRRLARVLERRADFLGAHLVAALSDAMLGEADLRRLPDQTLLPRAYDEVRRRTEGKALHSRADAEPRKAEEEAEEADEGVAAERPPQTAEPSATTPTRRRRRSAK